MLHKIDSGSNRIVYFDDVLNIVVKEEDIQGLIDNNCENALKKLQKREDLYTEAGLIFGDYFVQVSHLSLVLNSQRIKLRHFEPDLREIYNDKSFDCCIQNYLGLKDNSMSYEDTLAIKMFLTNQQTAELPAYTTELMEMLAKIQSINPKDYEEFCNMLLAYNRTGKSLDFAGKSNLIIDWNKNKLLLNNSAIKGNNLLQFYHTLPKFANGEYTKKNRCIFINTMASYLVNNQILSLIGLSLPISLYDHIRTVIDNWNVIHHAIYD